MHLSHSMLYAFRLSINQGVNPNLCRTTRYFDRSTTSAMFLALVGVSLSMFSLKQMEDSRQRRLRRD
ncbi:hypothetical protein HN011_000770 [Eciton burchellii]|nr:hypothetical protein HN011_000770 [Eciton burchellii]